MSSQKKLFTANQIVFSCIIGSVVLSMIMILINGVKLKYSKYDMITRLFYFLLFSSLIVYNIYMNDDMFGFITLYQFMSIGLIVVVYQTVKMSFSKDFVNQYESYSNLFVFNINLLFIFSLHFIVYLLFYKY